MNKPIAIAYLFGAFFLVQLSACVTDPIPGLGGSTLPPIIQDPGPENLCDPGVISFQHQVMPIMVSACAYSGCHDAITAADNIRLDTYKNVKKEVRPGNPNNSELYESITETDPDDIMPPPPASPLTSLQIGIIRDWIEQGAKDTDCGAPCDSTTSSFAADIFPLLQNYCVGCHNSARADGGVNIENYNEVIPYVENGALIGSIRHEPLFAIMPPSGSQLSTCRIVQIQKWINEGALNN